MYEKTNAMFVKGTLVSPTMCNFTYIMGNLVMYVRLYIAVFLMNNPNAFCTGECFPGGVI